MKKLIAQFFFVACIIVGSGVSALAYPYSGEWMFTMTGNDWNGSTTGNNSTIKNDIETAINDWFETKGIIREIELEYYDKVDEPNTTSVSMTVYYEDLFHGTWVTTAPVEFYTVKGSNEFAMYWLGENGLSSGAWSTEHLSAGTQGNTPQISHLSAYNPGTPVPEPTTMLLFGSGLAGLAAVVRRRRNA